MARICNDERASFGVMSGHDRKTLSLSVLGGAAAQWPVPGWISLWVDAAWIQAAQGSLTWALNALPDALLLLGSALGCIAPFIWVL